MSLVPSRRWGETRLTPRELLLLGVGALWSLLLFAATNIVGIPHLERVALLGAGAWVVAILATRSILLFSRARRATVRTVFVAVVLLTSGGPLVRTLGAPLSWLAISAVTGLSAWMLVRLEGEVVADVLVAALAVALISGPAIALVETLSIYGSSVVNESSVLAVDLETKPDIWLVVVDGYPGPQSQEMHAKPDDPAGPHPLESAGFDLAGSAWTSYRSTNSAIPSLLDMGYPVTVGSEGKATLADLYARVAGENTLTAVLDANGYETIMIESGWSGSSCGNDFDICVPSAFVDDPVGFVFRQSVPGESAFDAMGTPFNIGTAHVLEEMARLAGQEHSSPRFIFAHLMAPHPPFYLDAKCDLVVTDERRGYFFSVPGVPTAEREAYLEEQMECVDRSLSVFVSGLDESDTVVVTSDHGTDRRNQLVRAPEDWTREAIIERMNIFVATRLPQGCAIGDSMVLPNLMRRVLSCLTSQSIEEVPPRIFLGEGVELSSPEVEALLSGHTASINR